MDLAVIHVLSMVTVVKNNQKIGDLITLTSEICVSTFLPGINISTYTTRLLITMIEMNAFLRHLYLSVMAPTTGLISKAGSGSND
ncbi:unnamed protein product [Macrosiphum euphorbiae]|uniref:Uncharacterized protein n=1 Tax=Macrosiphum euphorbiae TaxID=13131 RepID=A0AAV0WY60_9HEMI|nr:unnamed protein product [Macrosiphum euphorbiae]